MALCFDQNSLGVGRFFLLVTTLTAVVVTVRAVARLERLFFFRTALGGANTGRLRHPPTFPRTNIMHTLIITDSAQPVLLALSGIEGS